MDIKELKTALGISNPIVIDECGDPNIFGTKGQLYVDGDGSYGPYWYLSVEGCRSKDKLSFMSLWQGDFIFKLDRLPTKSEASIIRKLGGFNKKREISPETREKLIERTKLYRFTNGPGKPNSSPGLVI